jgi:hypothetical protein
MTITEIEIKISDLRKAYSKHPDMDIRVEIHQLNKKRTKLLTNMMKVMK